MVHPAIHIILCEQSGMADNVKFAVNPTLAHFLAVPSAKAITLRCKAARGLATRPLEYSTKKEYHIINTYTTKLGLRGHGSQNRASDGDCNAW